jgi:hypothetical protein
MTKKPPVTSTTRQRIRAARRIDESRTGTLPVGRAENHRESPDLDDTIKRLKAYSEAGADCLRARHQDARRSRGLPPRSSEAATFDRWRVPSTWATSKPWACDA